MGVTILLWQIPHVHWCLPFFTPEQRTPHAMRGALRGHACSVLAKLVAKPITNGVPQARASVGYADACAWRELLWRSWRRP